MKKKKSTVELILPALFRKYGAWSEEFGVNVKDPNTKRSDDDTLLHQIAYRGGSIDELNFVVAAGANIDALGDMSYTPLQWAATQGHVKIVRRLVELGANVIPRNDFGCTAEDYAKHYGHTDALQILKAVRTRGQRA